MSYLALDRVPSEVSRSYLQKALEFIQVAVNNIDSQNFRKRLSLNKVEQFQREFCFLALAVPHSVANTSPQMIGRLFYWQPSKEPTGGTWWFEATMTSADASATAKLELFDGTNVLATLTTTNTALTRVRTAVTLPTSAAEIALRLYGTSASHAASVVGASLIFEK